MSDNKISKGISIEEGFEKLEDIIRKMERDEVSLEDSFTLYKEGIELIKECNEKIEKVEKQIKLIEGNETDGEF